MSIYAKFTIEQLGEAYVFHSAQDCAVSQRMAKEILDELVNRKGQRAAKIRRAFGFKTMSTDGELWVYADDEDCEPDYIINKNKEVVLVAGSEDAVFCALERMA